MLAICFFVVVVVVFCVCDQICFFLFYFIFKLYIIVLVLQISNVGNLISGSSAFLKTSLNIWKFTVHVLLKPGLENFEHYFTSV